MLCPRTGGLLHCSAAQSLADWRRVPVTVAGWCAKLARCPCYRRLVTTCRGWPRCSPARLRASEENLIRWGYRPRKPWSLCSLTGWGSQISGREQDTRVFLPRDWGRRKCCAPYFPPPPPPQSRRSARGSRPESTVSSAFERSIHATTNCAISSETGTLVCSRRHGSDHPRCLNKPRTSRVLSLVPLDTLIQDLPGWYCGVRATCLPRASRSGARLPNRLCERSEIHSFISTCQSLTHSRTRTDGNQRRGRGLSKNSMPLWPTLRNGCPGA